MQENNLILQISRRRFIRSSVLILSAFLFLIVFNLASLHIILSLVAVAFGYIFFKDYLWIFLVLSVPSLVFGRFIYFQINPAWIYEMSLAEIFILFAAMVFFIDKFLNSQIGRMKINSTAVILFLYALASFLFIWKIIDFRLYVFGLKVVIFSLLAYFLAFNLLTDRKKIILFLYGLVGTALVISIQIFYKFNEMGWSSKFFFDRSNILIPIGPIATTAAILALILPLILSFYFYTSNQVKAKPFILLSFIVGSLALFLTLGKAAILSLLIGLFYLFFKLKDKRVAFVIVSALFIVLSYIFFTSFFSGLFERVGYVFVDSNTKFRIDEYRVGWKLIKHNFLFGVGSGQQLVYFAKMMDMETGKMINNFFLQAFVDLGVIGLALVVTAVISIFRKTKNILKITQGKRKLIAYGFTAGLLAAFFNGLAEVTVFGIEYAIIFWLMAGVFINLNGQNESINHNN